MMARGYARAELGLIQRRPVARGLQTETAWNMSTARRWALRSGRSRASLAVRRGLVSSIPHTTSHISQARASFFEVEWFTPNSR